MLRSSLLIFSTVGWSRMNHVPSVLRVTCSGRVQLDPEWKGPAPRQHRGGGREYSGRHFWWWGKLQSPGFSVPATCIPPAVTLDPRLTSRSKYFNLELFLNLPAASPSPTICIVIIELLLPPALPSSQADTCTCILHRYTPWCCINSFYVPFTLLNIF